MVEAAKRCGVSPLRLAADNGLKSNAALAQGQALAVRRVHTFHTVRHGETMREIAVRYGSSVRALYRMNPSLCGLPRIHKGQLLAVQLADTPKRPLQILGIASPQSSTVSLRAALPFLTYMAPPACHTAPNGGLRIPEATHLFEAAADYSVVPLVYLRDSAPAVNRWVHTAVYAASQHNVAGAVTALADAAAHTALAARLSAENRLCLPLFKSVFYHAVDCVRGCVPVYISQKEAIRRAVHHEAKIRFDGTAEQPFFCYRDADCRTHTVWFYDARSWHTQIRQLSDGFTVFHVTDAIPLLVFSTVCCRVVE